MWGKALPRGGEQHEELIQSRAFTDCAIDLSEVQVGQLPWGG